VIILDTNVVSALMAGGREPAVIDWLDALPRPSVWTTAITVLEVEFGLESMSAGRRHDLRRAAFGRLLKEILENRVLSFDAAAGRETAQLMAQRRRAGKPVDLRDAMIAGIARATRGTLATRNSRHFEASGIRIVNPWRGA